MIKIQPSGDYVQLIYVDPVGQSVQQELKSDTDAFECSYDSDDKLYLQFGLMRFENPDPTDFTINGSAVTDAADFISKLNALFTGGGGGGGSIPNPLTEDVSINLDGHSFEMLNAEGQHGCLVVDATVDAERAYIQSTNDTDDGNNAIIGTQTTPTEARVYVKSDFQDGTKDSTITLITNTGSSSIVYESESHAFVGINEFADDAAAAAGGVPVNGLYHTAGAVKIRLS